MRIVRQTSHSLLISVVLGLCTAWVWAAERFPRVLSPTSETFRFPQHPYSSDSAAPVYLRRLLPVLKQAIRARISVERRLQAAAGNATHLDQVVQEYAGYQQAILRRLSRLYPPPEAKRIQEAIVRALHFQIQFYRHFAAWLHEQPNRRIRDEIADTRLQGCHLALHEAINQASRAFPRIGQQEWRVFREHLAALELL